MDRRGRGYQGAVRRFLPSLMTGAGGALRRKFSKAPEVHFRHILVPVFGTPLDDEIVATAGRLAVGRVKSPGGEIETRLDIIYVIEIALDLSLDAVLTEHESRGREVLRRAREVAEEYEGVEVTTALIRARRVGAGIVEVARRAPAEAIIVGADPPQAIGGGARLGGIDPSRPPEIEAALSYVLTNATCQVLLTASAPAIG